LSTVKKDCLFDDTTAARPEGAARLEKRTDEKKKESGSV